MDNPYTNYYVAAISAVIGASLPIVTKFIIDFFVSKRRLDIEETDRQFAAIRKERADVFDDLQKQLFALREQVLTLQRENFLYIQEKAELTAKVTILTEENRVLKLQVAQLDSEVKELKSVK